MIYENQESLLYSQMRLANKWSIWATTIHVNLFLDTDTRRSLLPRLIDPRVEVCGSVESYIPEA
jgi:hypothetical protein